VLVAKLQFYMNHGTRFAVAIDPATREVVELGSLPEHLTLDYDAIMGA
jgi:hypothetical protein